MSGYAQRSPYSRAPRRQLPGATGAGTGAEGVAVRLREARVAAFLGQEGGDAQDGLDELDELISRTARLFSESITEGTRKDYVRRWRKWTAWCHEKGFEPLDSPPEAVMLFLTDRAGHSGAALGTLRSYMAAINRIHVEAGVAPPGDDPAMTMFMRTLRKAVEPAGPQTEISALRIGQLRAVCRYLDSVGSDPVEVRDRALFALHQAGAGDGEIARLLWSDIRLTPSRATVRLRAVRSDRADRVIKILRGKDPLACGVRALTAWRDVGGTTIPWVITQTDRHGGRHNSEWSPRDVFRIRRARLASLGSHGAATPVRDVLVLLGGERPDVLRDKAMLLIGFAGAFRRTELVGLRWSDVSVVDSGVILRLRRSKTDRLGKGVDVGIPRGASSTTDPVAALLAWRFRMARQLGGDDIADGACFTSVGRSGRIGVDALTPSALTVLIRSRMSEAGIEGHWSGRSLRRGFISTAADVGMGLDEIAKGSRHATLDSLIRYIANDDPFRRNPLAQMGL